MDSNSVRPYIITDRLLLRPWEGVDAERLYALASDEELSRAAGWPVHTSVESSRDVIYRILKRPGSYAIVSRSERKVIGAIDLKFGSNGNICLEDGDAELGYWIGRDYWGKGYVPEAAKALIDVGFEELGLNNVWCLCTQENHNSKRVQEKCGFTYLRNGTINDPIYGTLDMRFTRITREEWSNRRLR